MWTSLRFLNVRNIPKDLMIHQRRAVKPLSTLINVTDYINTLKHQVETLEDDKKYLKETLRTQRADFEREMSIYTKQVAQLNSTNMELKSSLSAVVNMRAIFEVMLQSWRPKKNFTEASTELVNLLLKKNSKKETVHDLNDEAVGIVSQLEPLGGSMNIKSVAKDLVLLYHMLSRDIHYPTLTDTGIYIGGKFPLRAALGLAVLKLQELNRDCLNYDIFYCGDNWEKRYILSGGKVCNLPPLLAPTIPTSIPSQVIATSIPSPDTTTNN